MGLSFNDFTLYIKRSNVLNHFGFLSVVSDPSSDKNLEYCSSFRLGSFRIFFCHSLCS